MYSQLKPLSSSPPPPPHTQKKTQVGYVCVFSGIGCVLLAAFGAASYTASFSRFAGESFGAVVAGLFFQQAVKISVAQFHLDALYSRADAEAISSSSSTAPEAKTVASLYSLANGVFSLFIACGLVVTALLLRRARSARIGTPRLRGLVADYGAVIATGEFFYVAPFFLLFCALREGKRRERKAEESETSERQAKRDR